MRSLRARRGFTGGAEGWKGEEQQLPGSLFLSPRLPVNSPASAGLATLDRAKQSEQQAEIGERECEQEGREQRGPHCRSRRGTVDQQVGSARDRRVELSRQEAADARI